MSGTIQQFLLDLCRVFADKRLPCRVTCIPPRCRTPRAVDCRIDAIGTVGRVHVRCLGDDRRMSVPIHRVRRVELLES